MSWKHSMAATVIVASACGPAIDVHTIVSPDAGLSARRAFQLLPVPRPRTGDPLDARHPMLVNSITNRVLSTAVVQGFERRGYVHGDGKPDFAVAVYASARERLEVTYWDYGYPWRPRWWREGRRPGMAPIVTQYTEGTVIIDVIDPVNRELLWRGQGVARVSDDEEQYLTHLRTTVAAILERFPRAAPPIARAP